MDAPPQTVNPDAVRADIRRAHTDVEESLRSTRWEGVRKHHPEIAAAIEATTPDILTDAQWLNEKLADSRIYAHRLEQERAALRAQLNDEAKAGAELSWRMDELKNRLRKAEAATAVSINKHYATHKECQHLRAELAAANKLAEDRLSWGNEVHRQFVQETGRTSDLQRDLAAARGLLKRALTQLDPKSELAADIRTAYEGIAKEERPETPISAKTETAPKTEIAP